MTAKNLLYIVSLLIFVGCETSNLDQPRPARGTTFAVVEFDVLPNQRTGRIKIWVASDQTTEIAVINFIRYQKLPTETPSQGRNRISRAYSRSATGKVKMMENLEVLPPDFLEIYKQTQAALLESTSGSSNK